MPQGVGRAIRLLPQQTIGAELEIRTSERTNCWIGLILVRGYTNYPQRFLIGDKPVIQFGYLLQQCVQYVFSMCSVCISDSPFPHRVAPQRDVSTVMGMDSAGKTYRADTHEDITTCCFASR
jgi:hypothetical protein